MMRSRLRASLLCALLAGAAACDDDPTGSGPPAAVTLASGGDQAGPAGQPLASPVVIRVTDDDGDPVRGVEVRFVVTAGGGGVDPGVDSTDAQGQASALWRLGTAAADSQRLQVRVMDRNGGVAATTVVRATAQALAGQILTRVSTGLQEGAPGAVLPDSLTVRLLDALGNGVPGATVSWVVSPYAGTVSPTPSVTRADGTARVAWTLGAALGRQEATATVAGVASVITFGATVTGPFTITVQQPASAVHGDSLPVRVMAQSSTGAIIRLTARVEDRQTTLSQGAGFLSLAGLAEGPKVLQVWAVSAAGDSALATRPFVYNNAPRLTVTAPTQGTVLRTGTARVTGTCADPSGCTRVAVYAARYADSPPGDWVLLGEGATGFDGDVAVGAFNGRPMTLIVQATDALGGTSTLRRAPLYVENTGTWQEVASAGVLALDMDATRILYLDSLGGQERVMVRALAGGTPTALLSLPQGQEVRVARLFAGGAVFSTRDAIYESRGGAATTLASATNVGMRLSVEGDWAAWSSGGTLWRRRLSAGTTTVVSTDVLTGSHDVAGNGDVAFSTPGGAVIRWRDGVSTRVDAEQTGLLPVTDGVQVLWTSGPAAYLWRGGAPQWLVTTDTNLEYDVNGGWAAFVKPDAGGVRSVFTLAPDGTLRTASSGGRAILEALGPDGTAVYTIITGPANRRYASRPPHGTQVDIGGEMGTARFIGGELYVFVGRSAFRVSD